MKILKLPLIVLFLLVLTLFGYIVGNNRPMVSEPISMEVTQEPMPTIAQETSQRADGTNETLARAHDRITTQALRIKELEGITIQQKLAISRFADIVRANAKEISAKKEEVVKLNKDLKVAIYNWDANHKAWVDVSTRLSKAKIPEATWKEAIKGVYQRVKG